jgi:hypothetical protein
VPTKYYDTKDFVAGCREVNFTSHVAQNITDKRGSDQWAHDPTRQLQGKRAEAEAVEQGFGGDKTGEPLGKLLIAGRSWSAGSISSLQRRTTCKAADADRGGSVPMSRPRRREQVDSSLEPSQQPGAGSVWRASHFGQRAANNQFFSGSLKPGQSS